MYKVKKINFKTQLNIDVDTIMEVNLKSFEEEMNFSWNCETYPYFYKFYDFGTEEIKVGDHFVVQHLDLWVDKIWYDLELEIKYVILIAKKC